MNMSEPPDRSSLLDDILAAIARSRRYGGIDGAVVNRIASQMLDLSQGHVNEAIKRTKRHLHQIYGAYVSTPLSYDKLLAQLRQSSDLGPRAKRKTLRAILARHASTRERLPIMGRFYSEVLARTGQPEVLLDLGCGLQPLAAPWMELDPDCLVRAVDIDRNLLDFVVECLRLLGIRCESAICDLVAPLPQIQADLAFFLKSLPCVEQQEQGRGMAVVREAPVPVIVVSFPTHTLCGHSKGMQAVYSQRFEQAVRLEPWDVERLDFPGELVYIVRKAS